MDRESREIFEIIDEIQESLALDVTPASWPIGIGREFIGTYDHDPRPPRDLMDRADRNVRWLSRSRWTGLMTRGSPIMCRKICWRRSARRSRWRANSCRAFDVKAFLEGTYDADLVRLGDQFLRRQGTDGLGIADYGPAPQPRIGRAPAGVSPTRRRSRASSSRCRRTWTPSTATGWRSCGLLRSFQPGHETAPMCARRSRWQSRTLCCFSPLTARWPRTPGRGTSSASPTMANCGSATR